MTYIIKHAQLINTWFHEISKREHICKVSIDMKKTEHYQPSKVLFILLLIPTPTHKITTNLTSITCLILPYLQCV